LQIGNHRGFVKGHWAQLNGNVRALDCCTVG